MNLEKKKDLAVRTLNVGRERIVFNINRLSEIKEAITKQDIRDLVKEKAIVVKEIKGRRKIVKRRTRRRMGSIKKKIGNKKQEYVKLVRRLRKYLAEMRKQNKVSDENYRELRKEIRSGVHLTKNHLKEKILELK